MDESQGAGRESRYQLIVDALPDLLFVVDRDGRVVAINQATLNALGILGASTNPLGRHWREAFPALPNRTEEDLAQVFEQGAPTSAPCPLSSQGRGHAMVCVRVPLFDPRGKVLEVASLLRDVESELQTEEALRRERDLVRAIFESSPFAITISDPEGRVVDANRRAWNDARFASLQDMLGVNTLDLLEPGERARALEGIVKTLHTGELRGVRYLLRRADGTVHPGELSAGVIRDASGEARGFVGFTRDMTEATLVEERLRQAIRLESMGRFAGGVAHDFNDLIMAIQNYACFAAEALDPSHPAAEDLRSLIHAAKQAEELARHLVAFGQVAPGAPELFDPGERISKLARTFRQILGPEVAAELALVPDLWSVFMAPGCFENALVHLLVNARDRMPEGGMLVVRGENRKLSAQDPSLPPGKEPGEYVRLSVSDSGPCIQASLIGRIFEPFNKLDDFAAQGSIGLAAFHGLVSQAGGFTEARSGQGQRTELAFWLPRALHARSRSDSGDEVAISGSETILLVEDHAPVRSTAARALRQQGYQVLEAATAEDGYGLLEGAASKVALVLSDVLLPGESGFELARRVHASHPGLPVVLMSGFAPESLHVGGEQPPAADFLQKPFSPAQLLKRVRQVLGGA